MNDFPGLETKSSGVAIFLSFFWPGLGHLYLGRIVRALGMMAITLVLYSLTWALFDNLARIRTEIDTQYQNTVEMFTQQLIKHGDSLETASLQARVKALSYYRDWERDLGAKWVRFSAFGAVIVSIVWWTWGMVYARRLCERLNAEAYRMARPGSP